MTTEPNALIQKVAQILWANEKRLSDGFELYTFGYEAAVEIVNEIAAEIVATLLPTEPPATEPIMTPLPFEVRKELFSSLHRLSRFWAGQADKTAQERCDGLVHSILCIFDGVSGGLPAFDIIANGVLINDGIMLHEWYT